MAAVHAAPRIGHVPVHRHVWKTLVGMRAATSTTVLVALAIAFTPYFVQASRLAYLTGLVLGALILFIAAYEEFHESARHVNRVIGASLANLVAGAWLLGYAVVGEESMTYRVITAALALVLFWMESYNVAAWIRLRAARRD